MDGIKKIDDTVISTTGRNIAIEPEARRPSNYFEFPYHVSPRTALFVLHARVPILPTRRAVCTRVFGF